MVILGISPYTFLNIGFNLAISHSFGKVDNLINLLYFLKEDYCDILFFLLKSYSENRNRKLVLDPNFNIISYFNRTQPLSVKTNKKQGVPKASRQPAFMFQNVFRNILHSDLPNFDVLIQNGFRGIQKITAANLCKAYHDVIIISFLPSILNGKGWKIGRTTKTNILRT